MNRVVVDASTVLAFLTNESGGDVARKYCRGALISAINLTEVLQKAIERGNLAVTQSILSQIGLRVIPFDSNLAHVTADLMIQLKRRELTFRDYACIALGTVEKIPIVTVNRHWENLGLAVEIIVLEKWSGALN